jgi:hypothetical protein
MSKAYIHKNREVMPMDRSQLAMLMLQWEVKRRELDDMEAAIASAVMDMGETYNVGNVRATYSEGRKTFQYEIAARNLPRNDEWKAVVKNATREVTDWRTVCTELEVEVISFTQGKPSVSVKTVKPKIKTAKAVT